MIRPATSADRVAIATIHVRSWQAAYRGLLPDALLDGLSIPERIERWTTWLALPDTTTLVAEEGSALVGFARSMPCQDLAGTAEISHLYLDPDWFGRRIGRSLLEAIVDQAYRGGRSRCVLWVLEENHRARRFYHRSGFEADGQRATHPAFFGCDAVSIRYRRQGRRQGCGGLGSSDGLL